MPTPRIHPDRTLTQGEKAKRVRDRQKRHIERLEAALRHLLEAAEQTASLRSQFVATTCRAALEPNP